MTNFKKNYFTPTFIALYMLSFTFFVIFVTITYVGVTTGAMYESAFGTAYLFRAIGINNSIYLAITLYALLPICVFYVRKMITNYMQAQYFPQLMLIFEFSIIISMLMLTYINFIDAKGDVGQMTKIFEWYYNGV